MDALRRMFHLIAAITLIAATLVVVPDARAATITVNTTEDTVTNNSNCSLREAIQAANTNLAVDLCAAGSGAGTDVIAFSIGSGAQNIDLLTELIVTSPVLIDGTTQPGFVAGSPGVPLIRITGDYFDLIRFQTGSSGSTVKGLRLVNDKIGTLGNTVRLEADNILVAGNYLNTDGTASLGGDDTIGVMISDSSNSTVGGADAADRNLFGGHTGIRVDVGSTNTFRGNYFGLRADGISALTSQPSNQSAINLCFYVITLDCSGNVVRGNVISGFYEGVSINQFATSTLVAGNIIGLGADGTTDLGNGTGVHIYGADLNTIGGITAADRNVVSGNYTNVRLSSGSIYYPDDNIIRGNYIGTTADGLNRVTAYGDLSSDVYGVEVADGNGNVIGGTGPGYGNVIAGNSQGIPVRSAATNTVIQGNRIGTNADGTAALQQEVGIYLDGATADIGNAVTGGMNLISGNDYGIFLSNSTGSTIYGNRIGLTALGSFGIPNAEGIYLTNGSNAAIHRNWIGYNTFTGISIYDTSTASGELNCITFNVNWGVYSANSSVDAILESNYWGKPTGPDHAGNPSGTGDNVTDYVDYLPYLGDAYYQTCPRTASDFDGDGRTDAAKYTSGTHLLEYVRSTDGAWESQDMGMEALQYVRRSDFDGDGKADPAKFIPASGALWYLRSSDNAWHGEYLGPGVYEYLPASDFDGDGYTDPATYASGSNVLWYLETSSLTWQGVYLGPGTYTVVPGSDFDGDRKTDPATFNSGTNALWYRKSSNSTWQGVYLGPGTYEFVSGSDFDADGLDDPAHFDPVSHALWYYSTMLASWQSVYMGAGTLTYVPAADFDGDTATDPAQFDAGTNVLWWLKSSVDTWDSHWMGTGTYVIVD